MRTRGSLKDARLREMRDAIDHIEGALMALDLVELVELFETTGDAVVLQPPITVGELRRICSALAECTRIISSPEYEL